MALSFVLVPVLGKFFYGEQLSFLYFLGTAMILMGIIVITKFG
jgi:drug/metabolite transporter (DMT)-like permease